MASFLAQLTPPPFVQPETYDGWEARWRFLIFRPGLFKTEPYLLGGIVFYLLFFLWGAWVNNGKANKWLDAHLPVLTAQFSKPTVGRLTADGYSDFFNFSTGRRNLVSLHSVFALRPRHDFLQYAFQTLRTFVDLQVHYEDDLQLDFTLLPTALPYDFVWCLVSKDELLTIKNDRWDLSFTKSSENSQLPPGLTLMSEYADITEAIFKQTNLLSILSDPHNLKYFRSLSITDQPRLRPTTGPVPPHERSKHLILSLRAPPASKADATIALVTALFPFIDALPKISLRPETKSKLKKARDELDKELKEEAEREKKEEANKAKEDERARKRKEMEERVGKLSAAEQAKVLEKERKKSLRKMQGKMVKK